MNFKKSQFGPISFDFLYVNYKIDPPRPKKSK